MAACTKDHRLILIRVGGWATSGAHLAAFSAGKCSKHADTRHHIPDADSDRARLPGTGPAPRPGASEDVPGEGLTQEPPTRRPVSAGDRLVAAQASPRTGAGHTRKGKPQWTSPESRSQAGSGSPGSGR